MRKIVFESKINQEVRENLEGTLTNLENYMNHPKTKEEFQKRLVCYLDALDSGKLFGVNTKDYEKRFHGLTKNLNVDRYLSQHMD